VLAHPLAWLGIVASLGSMSAIPFLARARRHSWAFVASSVAIAGHVGLVGLGLYPRLLPALDATGRSLTLRNASSSHGTLSTLLVVAAIGMPVVVAYTAFIYRVFKGRVRPGELYASH